MRLPIFSLLLCLYSPLSCLGVVGTASWYGAGLKGQLMANGKPFNPVSLTCASWNYPLGTKLKITYYKKMVIVIVTDRGPNKRLKRLIDLSWGAFKQLADPQVGLITVAVEEVKQ